MPLLARPEGAVIQWDEVGDGPTVLVCNGFNLLAGAEMVALLAKSRRVITYEPRGLGRSSPHGPYDIETGAEDTVALLEEVGGAEVVLGVGDGSHRAMHAADRRPDLAGRVVITSTALGRAEDAAETGGFAASTGVLDALMSLLRTDYRSGLRSMVTYSGAADEDVMRERVESLAEAIPQESAVGYLEAWIRADGMDVARRLGGRLTVLAYRGNDWFPLSMYESLRNELTEACFEVLDDGPLNRPDLTAAVVLRVSEPARG